MLEGEGLAGAAEAGHNLVSDQKKVMAAGDFGDASQVAFGRRSSSESSADDRFEDKSCGSGGIGGSQRSFEIIGAGQAASGVSFVEGAVVAEAGSDMAPFGEERRVGSAAGEIATDSHRAKGAAVVALAAGEDAVAVGLAEFEEILADEFNGGFGGLGAARSKVDATVAKVGRSESEEAGSEFFGGGIMELRGVGKGELGGLGGHGSGDFWDAVADIDNGGRAGGVEEFAAVLGVEPAALAADGDRETFLEVARE